jgi:BMFP domain-containing protein YqiC
MMPAGVISGRPESSKPSSGIRKPLEAEQLERLLGRMNLVSREEFEATKAVAQAAREEQIKLERRLADLEARLEGNAPTQQS